MIENINENTDFSKLTHDDLVNVKKRFKPDHIVYIKAKCELERREYTRNRINDKLTLIILILTAIIVVLTFCIIFFK